MSAVLSSAYTLAVTTACTACGACVATCPEHALLPAPFRPATVDRLCTGCLACVEVCPRDAVLVGRATDTPVPA